MKKQKLLCGKCKTELDESMLCSVTDTVGEVYRERKALCCNNPDCSAPIHVISMTEGPIEKPKTFFGRSWLLAPIGRLLMGRT
ncbi:MAG: hypothetical protein C4586_08605 [Anaerolineaceae bacterium]|nr:MAG: hypothetical protein C4586_08605 [Anaerolineaceae bacterium]